MPQLSGPELVERLTSARPETRVLYMTGYTDIPIASDSAVLHNPFTPFTLARALRETLTPSAAGKTP